MNKAMSDLAKICPYGWRLALGLVPILVLLMFLGSCKRVGTTPSAEGGITLPLRDVMMLIRQGGVYVGTPNNLSWRKLRFGKDWALSSDHKYLAAGIDVLDMKTGTWSEIPVEVPEGVDNVILRWAPDKPVLALAFRSSYAMFTVPAKDRSQYGSSVFVWDMGEKKITRYDDARVDEDFRWLKDGEKIVYTQGAARSKNDHAAFDYSGYVFDFRTKATTRRDHPLEAGEWNIPDDVFPDGVLDKVYFDLHGGIADGLGLGWMSDSSCENPRTGDIVKTLDRPARLAIQKKGQASLSTVTDLPCGGFHVSFGYELNWKPRWLSDDQRVVMCGDANKLLIAEVVRGSVDELAGDVVEFCLIDPDLYEMRRDRMLRRLAPNGKINMDVFTRTRNY
jgi:hypothetical protein